MSELQRAVALAERRAMESVASERMKLELLLENALRHRQDGESKIDKSNEVGKEKNIKRVVEQVRK